VTDKDRGENLVWLAATLSNPLDSEEVLTATASGGLSIVYSSGVLTVSGTATPRVYEDVLQTLTYGNASQNPTETPRTIHVVAHDGQASSNIAVCTVSVDAVNDAPVVAVPAAQTTVSNTALFFAVAGGNAIAISDPDAGTGAISVTLSAISGTLTLSGTTGLTFVQGDGTADQMITFQGTLGDANAALDGMSFVPSPDYVGAATLTVVSDDQGNSGGPAQRSATGEVQITVTATPVSPAARHPILPAVAVVATVGWGAVVSARQQHVGKRRQMEET
jgi:hypothetical protein